MPIIYISGVDFVSGCAVRMCAVVRYECARVVRYECARFVRYECAQFCGASVSGFVGASESGFVRDIAKRSTEPFQTFLA